MPPKPPIEEGAVDEEAVDEEEELVFGVTRFPRTPQPWQSLGSEVEVEDENVVENRPKVMFMGNNQMITKHKNGIILYMYYNSV